MATKILCENVRNAVKVFSDIKQALKSKNSVIFDTTPATEYGTKIRRLTEFTGKGYVATEFDQEDHPITVAFYGMTKIPGSIFSSSSGNGAMKFLKNIDFSNVNITEIGSGAFSLCKKLKLSSLPSSVINIGSSAFYHCDSLALTAIPDGVSQLGYQTFSYCNSLKTLSIGSNMAYINSYAFQYCTSLTSITIAKPTGSISGAPLGATNATVTWTG